LLLAIFPSPHLKPPAPIYPVKFAKLQVGAGGVDECGFSCILNHLIVNSVWQIFAAVNLQRVHECKRR